METEEKRFAASENCNCVVETADDVPAIYSKVEPKPDAEVLAVRCDMLRLVGAPNEPPYTFKEMLDLFTKDEDGQFIPNFAIVRAMLGFVGRGVSTKRVLAFGEDTYLIREVYEIVEIDGRTMLSPVGRKHVGALPETPEAFFRKIEDEDLIMARFV